MDAVEMYDGRIGLLDVPHVNLDRLIKLKYGSLDVPALFVNEAVIRPVSEAASGRDMRNKCVHDSVRNGGTMSVEKSKTVRPPNPSCVAKSVIAY